MTLATKEQKLADALRIERHRAERGAKAARLLRAIAQKHAYKSLRPAPAYTAGGRAKWPCCLDCKGFSPNIPGIRERVRADQIGHRANCLFIAAQVAANDAIGVDNPATQEPPQ